MGSEDFLTRDEMLDIAANVQGRPPTAKLHVPLGLLGAAVPLIQLVAKLPRGAVKGMVEVMGMDIDGDTSKLRELFPRPLVGFEAATRASLATPYTTEARHDG